MTTPFPLSLPYVLNSILRFGLTYSYIFLALRTTSASTTEDNRRHLQLRRAIPGEQVHLAVTNFATVLASSSSIV